MFAYVLGRRVGQLRFGDLDVVPEHAVVPDLQRIDAGAGALGLFHRCDRRFSASADPAQTIEFVVHAVDVRLLKFWPVLNHLKLLDGAVSSQYPAEISMEPEPTRFVV